ncbi:hypothetical protein PQI23_07625 [Leucobacter sp. USCH14]|uniref:hypothetical protein n=1 Tax=Leucobacter sp. USCH14 TaxID=3024838 RepID=UPI0030AD5999
MWVGILAAFGTLLAAFSKLVFDADSGNATTLTVLGLVLSFIAAVWLAVASGIDKSKEEELREQARTAKSDGFQAAASMVKSLMQKHHRNISNWSPEVGDILREAAVDLARHFLEGIGVEKVRVSLYTPSAAEDGPDESDSTTSEYTALSLRYASCGVGRHEPKNLHELSAETRHMFEALTSSAPSSPAPRKAKKSGPMGWRQARQMGVGANGGEPIGLLTADSVSGEPFPQQADDIIILAVELLLLTDRTTKQMLGQQT